MKKILLSVALFGFMGCGPSTQKFQNSAGEPTDAIVNGDQLSEGTSKTPGITLIKTADPFPLIIRLSSLEVAPIKQWAAVTTTPEPI